MKIAQRVMVLALLASVAEAGQLTGSKAPDFALFDQRDRQVTLRHLEGKTVVLIASDDEGAKQNPGWKKAVEPYRERVSVFGVADVRRVPFFLKNRFKREFRQDAATILLDWEGALFTSYGLEKSVSNVVVIDKNGVVRYLHAGGAEQAAVEAFCTELDKSLE